MSEAEENIFGRTAHQLNNEQLRSTVQRQADTIESLHAAAQKYKTRLTALEQQLVVKQAEIDSMRVLAKENAHLRESNLISSERVRELELNSSRLAEQSSLGAETQAQLGVKVQAYQRHNHFLQGELASKDSKLKTLHERLDVLTEEVRTKDKRITLLVEKLKQFNIDPTAVVNKIHISEEVFSQMKDKLDTQSTTIELLREKMDGLQEESIRREELIEAQRRENNTLKTTISKLIAQVNAGVTMVSAAGNSNVLPSSDKLKAYHNRRADSAGSTA